MQGRRIGRPYRSATRARSIGPGLRLLRLSGRPRRAPHGQVGRQGAEGIEGQRWPPHNMDDPHRRHRSCASAAAHASASQLRVDRETPTTIAFRFMCRPRLLTRTPGSAARGIHRARTSPVAVPGPQLRRPTDVVRLGSDPGSSSMVQPLRLKAYKVEFQGDITARAGARSCSGVRPNALELARCSPRHARVRAGFWSCEAMPESVSRRSSNTR